MAASRPPVTRQIVNAFWGASVKEARLWLVRGRAKELSPLLLDLKGRLVVGLASGNVRAVRERAEVRI